MLTGQGVLLNEVESGEIDRPFGLQGTEQADKILKGHKGSGSGGYAHFIFQYAALHLFQASNVTVEFRNLRNPDFKEAIFEKDGKILLRFAIANGFKNIQNLVQKLKRGKSVYHYVEVMACPSGKFPFLYYSLMIMQLTKQSFRLSEWRSPNKTSGRFSAPRIG